MSRGDELAQVGDISLSVCSYLVMVFVVCSGVQGRLKDNAPRASDVQIQNLRKVLFLLRPEAGHRATRKSTYYYLTDEVTQCVGQWWSPKCWI